MTSSAYHTVLTELADGQGIERAAIEVKSTPASVRDARSFVRQQLFGWRFPEAGDFTDGVLLAVSELVTNAVLHGRTRSADDSEHVGIALALKPGRALGVLVTDNSNEAPVAAVRPDPHATCGRGLELVDAVADYWTAAPRGNAQGVPGKGVWAVFRCPEFAGLLPRSA
ncbi:MULTISPECIES: ATP-binding protein [Streptomyces]|uniref:ATP-binding protein n=1 Tax=Streptomyces salinarius TaxID=2762598 RepID=A0ABW8BES4_9ACTN|nr:MULTISPECIES: ATP-binding protein [unclassified Streptomyces]NDZ75155.1 ATP-binding protein [Streptomyces sp. SID10362]WKX17098.1 ATP-binding protein [Streptomyces sp. HUAS CX7]